MKTLTSSRDLFIFGLFSVFLSLLLSTNDCAQKLKSQSTTINQSRILSNQLQFLAANNENAGTYDSDSKAISSFSNLKQTELEALAFRLINEQRALKNLKPLKLDLGMLYLARQHSAEMAEFKYFSHRGRDGSMADGRATKAGITDCQGIGENIAFSQNAKNEVQSAVKGWMNSPRHRNNLLNPIWTKSGIGIAVTSDHRFYITQVFRE